MSIEPTREQVLEFCARDPVERVFLEDVARRGLGRFVADRGADGGCARSATSARTSSRRGGLRRPSRRPRREGRSRMIIGEAGAVDDALGRGARAAAGAARGPSRASPCTRSTSRRRPGETGLRAATPRDLDLLVPGVRGGARARARHRSAGTRRRRLPLAHTRADRRGPLLDLARGRRRALQGRGVGVDAARRCRSSRCGPTRGARPRLRARAACATSAGCCSRRRRP